jgi:hypothetical protein
MRQYKGVRAIRQLIAGTPLYPLARKVWAIKVKRDWKKEGRPSPPPAQVKHDVVKRYAHNFRPRTFIETGTHLGQMVEAVKDEFDSVISIELDEKLWLAAKLRFENDPHVQILLGDSARVLPQVLQSLDHPALFWLDGHFSGGETALGTKSTPIVEELTHIFEHSVQDHVVLIDDARDFIGRSDYPSLNWMRRFTVEHRPDWSFAVEEDIIRLYPRENDS